MKSITREDVTYYGKFAAATVVGVGVGLTGYAANDTPTKETDTYKNLQDELGTLEDDNADLTEKVADLQTSVTDKEERVNALEASVEQRQTVIADLRAENADLEEALAAPQERAGLVDYLPVSGDEDVELSYVRAEVDTTADNTNLQDRVDGTLSLDSDKMEGEEYDEVRVDYTHEDYDHAYKVTVRTFEESGDADEYEEELRETVDEQEYDEEVQEDAYVYRDGDTVVYVHGDGDLDEVGYDFESYVSQYE